MFYIKYLTMHKVHMHAGAIKQLLYGCVYIQEIIHSLKLVDYLPVHTHNPYNNLHIKKSSLKHLLLFYLQNQCLKLRCPLGKAPYKGECKTFLLPTSHLTLTVYYYLRVEWEDTYQSTKNSALNGTLIGEDVISHFLNESLRYNKKCTFCTLEFNMMPPNQIHGLGDFILKLEMRTSDVCPLETLQVNLLEPVDKRIAVKIRGDTAMTINLQVSLLPEEKVLAYETICQSMGTLLIELIHRPCIRSYVVLRDSITCPQVEITESVIQSITDYHVKTTLGLLFNSTAKVDEHDTAVMYMCVDEYFDLVYRTGMAVRLEDPKILTLTQVIVVISLFIVR